MIVGPLMHLEAARQRAARCQSEQERLLIAQMDARAYAAWQEHGDRYAGLEALGRVVLWGATRIPKIQRKATQEDTHG